MTQSTCCTDCKGDRHGGYQRAQSEDRRAGSRSTNGALNSIEDCENATDSKSAGSSHEGARSESTHGSSPKKWELPHPAGRLFPVGELNVN